MANLTPKRVTVLRELDALDRAASWARGADGFWLPFHVVYFRGAGRKTLTAYPPSFVYEAGMSVDAASSHLRRLATDGLVVRRGAGGSSRRGQPSEYKVNDAGRAALAEWDKGQEA